MVICGWGSWPWGGAVFIAFDLGAWRAGQTGFGRLGWGAGCVDSVVVGFSGVGFGAGMIWLVVMMVVVKPWMIFFLIIGGVILMGGGAGAVDWI